MIEFIDEADYFARTGFLFPISIRNEIEMAQRKFTTEIEELLSNIEESIKFIKLDARHRGISPYGMKHIDGSLAIERLLLAKAHALHTLVILKDTSWLHEN